MADFDPQGPTDNESKNQADQAESCCGSGGSCDGDKRDSYSSSPYSSDPFRHDPFVADWSGAEKSLEAQAESFETRRAEMSQSEPQGGQPAAERSETFWVEMVQSQESPQAPAQTSSSTELTLAGESAVGVQSEQFWADLVRSQQTTSSSESTSRPVSWLSEPPSGMGWSEDEASEWSPPEREQLPEPSREDARDYEAVESAAEPVETEASAPRQDVAWSEPASASQDWASARSEGFAPSETSAEEKPSLMSAAVEAAQAQAKPKKKAAAKKKPAAKKPAKAKKKPAAKKPKKAVKKATPPPKITKAPPTKKAA